MTNLHNKCVCKGTRRLVSATVRIIRGGKVIEERVYEHPCPCTSQLLQGPDGYVSPPES